MSAPELKVVAEEAVQIAKPAAFDLNKFKSKRGSATAVEVMPTALPVLKLADAKDFVRLHHDEDNYWSGEICLVNVPALGQKKDTLHLIDDDLAATAIPRKPLIRCRLVLATKPYDVHFLAVVPSQNLDNDWNSSNLKACMAAKDSWVEVYSLREQNKDGYGWTPADSQDAFPTPMWGTQTLWERIGITFAGRMIEDPNSDALKRLRGAKISAS